MDEPDTEKASTDGRSSVVGTDQPVHRINNIHPVLGVRDASRDAVGNRRRIEQLEFKLGYVICGHRSSYTGEYCTEKPEQGKMRCIKHQGNPVIIPQVNPKYSMTSQVFQRCQLCRVKNCDYRNLQSGGSECVIERDLYENLNTEVKNFDNYGESTKHLFEQLVWSRLLLFRAYSQLASEGLTVTEVTGFAERDGVITPLENDREHPVLKHVAKLQQMDKQLCDALELTPSARTKKGEVDNSARTQNNISDLLKKAFVRFGESREPSQG